MTATDRRHAYRTARHHTDRTTARAIVAMLDTPRPTIRRPSHRCGYGIGYNR